MSEDVREPAEKPKAPAGWYPHPSMAATRRYWDGAKWTDHIAPDDGPRPPRPGAGPERAHGPKVDPSYAWALALLPLVWIPFDYFAPEVSYTSAVIIGTWCVSLVLAALDARRIKATNGATVSTWWAVVFVPLYLIARTRAVRSTPAIPLAWLATFGLYVLASFTFAAVYEYDEAEVEAEIEAWFADTYSSRNVRVDCPDITGRPGDTFDCTARGDGQSAPVRVTLTDDGGYKWQVG